VTNHDADLELARIEAQKQWNTNPCGAVEGDIYDRAYFAEVESERYRQQYWQRDYFDYRSFSGKSVLEIGTGLGTDIKQFARNGAKCSGADITDTHLEMTRLNFELEGLPIDLVKADAVNMPFPDNSFDCVHSFGVLHHIPDVQAVLREIRRVLKPGGVLQTAVYHKHSIHTAALFAFAMVNGTFFKNGVRGTLATIERGADGQEIVPYVRLYSKGEWRKTVESAGFVTRRNGVRQINFDDYPWLNTLRPLDGMLGWYVANIAEKPGAAAASER
jgi:ubiquinone/menaquinone biosynthesis C-methylase UbiE